MTDKSFEERVFVFLNEKQHEDGMRLPKKYCSYMDKMELTTALLALVREEVLKCDRYTALEEDDAILVKDIAEHFGGGR